MICTSSRRAYQTSIVRILANPAIASRYAATDARVTARASALENPLLRAAMVKLAAIFPWPCCGAHHPRRVR